MTYISGVVSTEPKSTYDELLFLIIGTIKITLTITLTTTRKNY
jgi:hypothetical protein